MKKTFQLASLFLIILVAVSCVSTSRVAQKITVESGEIPPEMVTEDFTLIGVLKGRRSYDRYLKKKFSDYTGDYILATKEEIEKKYSDVNKYRYIMDYQSETDVKAGLDSYGQVQSTTGYRYSILDRKKDKEYYRKSRSSAFAKEIEAYLLAIELARK